MGEVISILRGKHSKYAVRRRCLFCASVFVVEPTDMVLDEVRYFLPKPVFEGEWKTCPKCHSKDTEKVS